MNDEMREAFEHWHDCRFEGSARTDREPFGYPNNSAMQQRFQAFQAAYQLQQTKLDKAVEALERASTATTGGMRAYIEETLVEIKEIKI